MPRSLVEAALLGLLGGVCAPAAAPSQAPAAATPPAASTSAGATARLANGPGAASAADTPNSSGPAPRSIAASAAAPPPLTPLRITGSEVSGNGLAPWATFEGGYFHKYGLGVDSVPDIAASTTAVQTLVARDVDLINTNPNPAMKASLKGGVDLVYLANTPPGSGFWLYAAPGIRAVDDPRGKVVAANQPGTLTYFALNYALRTRDLETGKDFDVLSVGNQAAQLAAVQNGQVVAAVMSSPASALARRTGLVELVDLNDVPLNAHGPIVRRDVLDDPAGRDRLVRYLKATVEGIARFRQDRAFANAVIAKYLQVTDPEVQDEIYTTYLPKRVPHMDERGIELILVSIAQRDEAARGADPRRFYDNSLVEELQRSGFVDALYPAP